jgi:hypothetical protein
LCATSTCDVDVRRSRIWNDVQLPNVGDKLRRYGGKLESSRIGVRCSVALGVKKRVLMRLIFTKERTTFVCDVDVRGGSTVLVVKPLGRSRGEFRLLLAGFLS